MEQDNTVILFQERLIRRVWHNDEWYFVSERCGASIDGFNKC